MQRLRVFRYGLARLCLPPTTVDSPQATMQRLRQALTAPLLARSYSSSHPPPVTFENVSMHYFGRVCVRGGALLDVQVCAIDAQQFPAQNAVLISADQVAEPVPVYMYVLLCQGTHSSSNTSVNHQ